MTRISFLNCPIDNLSLLETVEIIRHGIREGRFIRHVVVNVAKIVNLQRDEALRAAVINSDIINVDGMGVVWGARFLGHHLRERVAGIDLFYALLNMSADEGFPVFFLGAEEHVVKMTAIRIQELHPTLRIAGYHNGFFGDGEEIIVDMIRSSGASLLFVAITSPYKEKFVDRWGSKLGVRFVMGVGGTFDVVAGKVRRAPIWMQNSGLEWLYRVLQEPKRLFARYLSTNLKFLWILLRMKLKSVFIKE
ncbi:MAG: WecB/TagA/CpsF family glycosyltransferase [Anaerolineales bacterium]|nr:WecB/TagA/CpsF family glycosyltransferase [Anaerolineales bacterium]MCW5855100.1 WecB/TagA/CpsF family glycosyltransferase [Anaerolineales bacterium]